MDKGFVILTEIQLKEIVENAFDSGAKSHNEWEGQRDTCWSNVYEDKKEHVEMVVRTYCA